MDINNISWRSAVFSRGVCRRFSRKDDFQNFYRSFPPASSSRQRRQCCSTSKMWRIPLKGNSRQHWNWSRYRTRDHSWMRRPTTTWRQLRNRVRTVERFEAINRNGVVVHKSNSFSPEPKCRLRRLRFLSGCLRYR